MKRYGYCAWGLTAVLAAGTFLPGISALKDFIAASYLNPVSILWSLTALAIFLWLPRLHGPGRLRTKNQACTMALAAAVMLLALRFGAGFLLQSVAASPYDLSPRGMLKNVFDIVTAILAREMIRAYALGAACKNSKHSQIWIALITLLWALCEVNFAKILTLSNNKDWFIYIAKDILPLITQSCLLTVLVLSGGAAAGVIYAASIGVFTHIFPFLPSLPWIADSAVGITFPALTALFIWGWHKTITRQQARRRPERIGSFSVALVLTVAFSWFVAGVFPLYPSVILTGSMEPEIFPGDIVLIQKFTTEQEVYGLAESDVINFKREDISITHRISAVHYDPEGNIFFQTKGDNNKTADDVAVLPADLNGIVKKVVPKIGTPILWLQGSDTVPQGVVDN